MDIFSPTILDDALITGSNTANLLRVSSPSATNALFVSGSGTVAIGTSTPSNAVGKLVMGLDGDGNGIGFYNGTGTSLRIWRDSDIGYIGRGTNPAISINASSNVGIGETSPSAKLEIRGSGATSSTTALRVENSSAAARLTILDDGTSAFNTSHLYVSSSGNVGIRTTTPGTELDVSGDIRASNNVYASNLRVNTIFLNTGTFLRFLSASVETARYDNNGWGFFNTTPTAKVHISGANNEALLQVSSPSNANILFVTGSGRVGIKNSTPLYDLSVGGNINIQSSGFLDFGNGNSRVVDLGLTSGQGYPLAFHTFGPIGTGTSNNIVEKMRLTGSGSLGLGTTNPSARFHISGGFTDGNLMRIQSTTGAEYFFISASGNVGIGTSTPTNTLQVVGGITATSITSSLLGTASVSVNAQTASFLPIGTYNITSSWAQSASNAVNAQTASFLPIGTYSITSSWATNALTASNITPSITNNTDNRVLTATGGGTINGETNLTFDGSVLTVTGRANISTSITSSTATIGFGLTSALNAGQTTIRSSGVDTVGALTIQNSGGTGTFTVLNGGTTGVGENNPSARLHVKGSGATSATTALRVENSSAAARLTILDDGTSAFNTNHLYVSSSGLVGIGTTLPTAELHISGANADALLRVSSPAVNNILFVTGSGRVGIGTSNPGVTLDVVGGSIRTSNTMFNSTTQTNTIQLSSATNLQFLSASVETARYDSNGWGFFNTTPTAKVHISGANADNLFRISSPSATNALFVTGSGNVGIGTNLPSAELHISGASADNLLRVGSPTNANILFVTGSGRVGIGTSTPTNALTVSGTIESLPISTDEGGQLTLRAATGRSFRWNVDNYQDNFRIFRENDSDSSGGVVRIFISGSSGNVGIHTTTPTEWIYLSTTPSAGKYLNIDAVQTSNNPPDYGASGGGGVDRIIGNTQDNYALGTPDYWMEIKLNGGIVLIPAYLPAP